MTTSVCICRRVTGDNPDCITHAPASPRGAGSPTGEIPATPREEFEKALSECYVECGGDVCAFHKHAEKLLALYDEKPTGFGWSEGNAALRSVTPQFTQEDVRELRRVARLIAPIGYGHAAEKLVNLATRLSALRVPDTAPSVVTELDGLIRRLDLAYTSSEGGSRYAAIADLRKYVASIRGVAFAEADVHRLRIVKSELQTRDTAVAIDCPWFDDFIDRIERSLRVPDTEPSVFTCGICGNTTYLPHDCPAFARRAPNKEPQMEIGEFHNRDGVFFKRLDDGSVRLRIAAGEPFGLTHDINHVIPANEWASVVASVAKGGESENYTIAQGVHGV